MYDDRDKNVVASILGRRSRAAGEESNAPSSVAHSARCCWVTHNTLVRRVSIVVVACTLPVRRLRGMNEDSHTELEQNPGASGNFPAH